jgi:Protein of unknown function (DUF3592)
VGAGRSLPGRTRQPSPTASRSWTATVAPRCRCTLSSVRPPDWQTRPDRRPIVFVILGVIVLGFAGFLASDVVAEYDDRAIIHDRGQRVKATVVEVLERGRRDETQHVRTRLPDGRTADVDLADSAQRWSEPGRSIRITVDPTDLSRNLPDDILYREVPFTVAMIMHIGPVVLVATGWFIAAAVTARNASWQSKTPGPPQPDRAAGHGT